MYRSGSTSRFSDDHFSYYGSSSSPSSKVPTALRALSDNESDELPMYEPASMADKKERSRAKFAEKAVHVIPLVLLLCAFILWIFSNPDIRLRESSVAEEIEGMANKGDLASDDTGHLPLHLRVIPIPRNHGPQMSVHINLKTCVVLLALNLLTLVCFPLIYSTQTSKYEKSSVSKIKSGT